MDTIRKIFRSPITTIVLFVIAVGLLLSSTIGGTRAALSYYADSYSLEMQLQDIGVTLNENGRSVGSSANGRMDSVELLSGMLADGEKLQLGVAYPEVLTVTNSGTIDEYVRVSVYRYWVDGNGEKRQELDPSLIELGLANTDLWREDAASSTPERTVLYYTRTLSAGASTPAFLDALTISGDVAAKVSQSSHVTTDASGRSYNTVTTTYDYDGMEFRLQVEVDTVQTHNAAAAIRSAWGVDASVVGVG